jgi:hypothetical protein
LFFIGIYVCNVTTESELKIWTEVFPFFTVQCAISRENTTTTVS